jgi:hypothetical protein
MKPMRMNTAHDRLSIANEILELGETLFDAVLEVAARCPIGENDEPFPETEMRTAADEFLNAVRVLLGIQSTSLAKVDELESADQKVTA